jgi:hypothetical protein
LIGPQSAAVVPALVSAFAHPDDHVHQTAAIALERFGPEAAPAIPALVSALGGNRFVSDPARRALAGIGAAAVPALVPALASKNHFVRREAAGLLVLLRREAGPAVPALTVALAETVGCTAPSSITAIRVIRVNVVTGKVIIDSTTGRRSPYDPAGIDCVGYFQPAIQVNKNGDTAFGYMREAQGQVPTEARYTVIYHGSLVQPPSALLQVGKTDVGSGFDTSGVSLDPDDQAIWFVTPYGSPMGAQIAIGRIWGQ